MDHDRQGKYSGVEVLETLEEAVNYNRFVAEFIESFQIFSGNGLIRSKERAIEVCDKKTLIRLNGVVL